MNELELFNKWMPLAEAKANKMVAKEHLEDAIQEAYLGLWNAVKTYESEFPVKFSTYATVCISNNILDYMRKELRQTEDFETSNTLDEIPYEIESVEDGIIMNDTVKEIISCCGDMTEREEDVLFERLMAESPATLQYLADRHGTSRTSIIRDEERLKDRIREEFKHGNGNDS